MHNKSSYTQLIRFVIVGVSNAVISYIVFFILYSKLLAGDAFYSQCLSYAAGIIWSFFWNKKWTFSEKKHSWAVFSRFLILQLVLLFVSAFFLDLTKNNLNLNIYLIWVCVMAVITFLNFVLSKSLVFRA